MLLNHVLMGEFVATIDPDGDAIVYNETFSGYLSPEPSAYWRGITSCANLAWCYSNLDSNLFGALSVAIICHCFSPS